MNILLWQRNFIILHSTHEWMSAFGCISLFYVYTFDIFTWGQCCHRLSLSVLVCVCVCLFVQRKNANKYLKSLNQKWMEKKIKRCIGKMKKQKRHTQRHNENFNKCCITFAVAMFNDMLRKNSQLAYLVPSLFWVVFLAMLYTLFYQSIAYTLEQFIFEFTLSLQRIFSQNNELRGKK